MRYETIRRAVLMVLVAVLVFLHTTAHAQGKTAALDGLEIYYEVYGEGSPLLLLHGFSGSGEVWKNFAPEFAKQYKVIVPDLRGHGRSGNPAKDFTHRQSARDMFALLDHLGIQQFRAMGISTGGMTLLHMATQQPARVESMVLIGATIYFPEEARAIMRKSEPEARFERDKERLRNTHKRGDAQIRALLEQFHAFKDSYDDMNFTAPYLSTIKARTLVVHGDRDQFFPVGIPVEMYRSIPRSYLWILPNGGHVPINRQPAFFTHTVLEFLQGLWEKK